MTIRYLAAKSALILALVGTAWTQTNYTGPMVVLPKADDSAAAEIRLREKNTQGLNYTGFKAPAALGSNIVYELPASDGGLKYCLTTNNNKILSWGPCIMPDAGNFIGDVTIQKASPALHLYGTETNAGLWSIQEDAGRLYFTKAGVPDYPALFLSSTEAAYFKQGVHTDLGVSALTNYYMNGQSFMDSSLNLSSIGNIGMTGTLTGATNLPTLGGNNTFTGINTFNSQEVYFGVGIHTKTPGGVPSTAYIKSHSFEISDVNNGGAFYAINAFHSAPGSYMVIKDPAGSPVLTLNRSPNNIAQLDSNLIPKTADPFAYDLGAQATRWNKLWVKDIDFSGVLTGVTFDLPANVVLTDTEQTITGAKTFVGDVSAGGSDWTGYYASADGAIATMRVSDAGSYAGYGAGRVGFIGTDTNHPFMIRANAAPSIIVWPNTNTQFLGNVGINTATVNDTLSVNGSIGYYDPGHAVDNILHVGGSGSPENALGSSWRVRRNYDNIDLFKVGGNGQGYFRTTVGIGIDPALEALHVSGGVRIDVGGGVALQNQDGVGNLLWSIKRGTSADGNDMAMRAYGGFSFAPGNTDTSLVRISNSGNMGVGYTDPGTYKLKVNGDAYFNGTLTSTGTAQFASISGNLNPANTIYALGEAGAGYHWGATHTESLFAYSSANVAGITPVGNATNTYDVGGADYRFKDGYFAGTISAGAVSASAIAGTSVGTDGFTLHTGPGLGKVLTSDALGVGTWQDPASSGVSSVTASSPLSSSGGATPDISCPTCLTATNVSDVQGKTFAQHIIPKALAIYDVGDATWKFRDAYFSGTVSAATGVSAGAIAATSMGTNTINIYTGAGAGKVLTSDALGAGTWQDPAVGISSVTATSPLASSGGSDPDISCSTCLTTSGSQQVSGKTWAQSMLPVLTSTYDLGGVSNRWNTIYANTINTGTAYQPTGSIYPSVNGAYDLGGTTFKFKDGWFSGTVYANTVSAASVSLSGNVLAGGTVQGGSGVIAGVGSAFGISGGSWGMTRALSVRNSADNGSCSITVTGGIIVASTC